MQVTSLLNLVKNNYTINNKSLNLAQHKFNVCNVNFDLVVQYTVWFKPRIVGSIIVKDLGKL